MKDLWTKMKNDFTQIENKIINLTSISDGAFRTYLVLRSFKYGSNRVFPSIDTIAKQRGKHPNTISNHLKELRKAILITSKKRGYSTSNEYFFNITNNCGNESKNKLINWGAISQSNVAQSHQKVDANNTKDNNIKINNNEEIDNETEEERQKKWNRFEQQACERNPWLEQSLKQIRERKKLLVKKMSF